MKVREKWPLGAELRRARLSAGGHSSPGDGICVVELASLLGGGPFSDRPRCVCPVIAAFLRAFNDRLGHADRQRLRPFAARIVGSRGDAEAAAARRERCLAWIRAELTRRGERRLTGRLGVRIRIAAFSGIAGAIRLEEGAADYAARLAFARGDAEVAFALLEALLGEPACAPTERRFAHASVQPAPRAPRRRGPHPTGGAHRDRHRARVPERDRAPGATTSR